MSGLKLFVDMISQPCRAICLLLEINNIPYTKEVVNLGKGQQFTNAELQSVNPNCKVPTLKEGTFSLYESGAILRYLCSSRKLPDHWYPQELKTRAKVDQYLDWHHSTIRFGSSGWFFSQHMLKKPVTHPRIVESKKLLIKSLDILNDHTLKDSEFIAGDKISIADLQAVCELTQHWMVQKNVYAGYPNIEKWVGACLRELQPQFDEVHALLYKVRDKQIFGVDSEPLKSKL